MRVLVTTKLLPEGFTELMENHEVVFPQNDIFTKQELINIVHTFDVIIPTFQFEIDKDVLDACRNSVKIIANFGVGFNNIDVEYATQCGIVVTNTPDPVVEPTAEQAHALMLAAARRVSECDRKMRIKDGIKWGVMENLGQTLYGKTLGIIGMGRIGQALARRAVASGMKIVYYNRTRLSVDIETKYNAERIELDDLIRMSDVISIHTPMTAETHHLINAERFNQMKSSVILVNTARGPVIDEAELINALKSNKIYAAALDVYEFEPAVSEELLTLDNVVLAPHNGTATVEARIEMSRFASRNVIRFFEGSTDITRVN